MLQPPDVPLQNRVTPLGELIAHPARGLVYGNRGCLHDADGRIRRRYQVRRWIACRLEFRGRRRSPLMQPGRYTELFFLDDATALAAGHRPCAECRREDYDRFTSALAGPPRRRRRRRDRRAAPRRANRPGDPRAPPPPGGGGRAARRRVRAARRLAEARARRRAADVGSRWLRRARAASERIGSAGHAACPRGRPPLGLAAHGGSVAPSVDGA